ncbi:MAG TPA: porin family protein [Anaeromyxobacter sp.]
MKKLFALLALFPVAAFAQAIDPGTLELSGETSLSFLSSSIDVKSGGATTSGDQQNWDLRGSGLYYVAPNIGVGATLSYQSETLKVDGIFDNKTSTFTVGPAVGVTFPVAPQVAVFGRGSIVYAESSMNFGGGDVNSSGWGIGLEAGVKYFPVKAISLDAGVAFQYLSLTGDTSPSVDISSTGIGVNVGVSVYFGRL